MKSEQVKAYPRIFTAAEKARSVLLQHYNKTDLTHIYTVATAMVPRLKYEYWEVDGWGETYLEPAKNMVKKYGSSTISSSRTLFSQSTQVMTL